MKKRNFTQMVFMSVLLILSAYLAACSRQTDEHVRIREKFNDGWSFVNEDTKNAHAADCRRTKPHR